MSVEHSPQSCTIDTNETAQQKRKTSERYNNMNTPQIEKQQSNIPKELLVGKGVRIGIAVARFNPQITTQMKHICIQRLQEIGVDIQQNLMIETPGSYELPLAARMLIEETNADAVIAIGVVIRGETDHYHHIANAASQGLMKVADDTRKPVVFGELTTDTVEQAVERIHLATSYAETAVEMVNTYRNLTRNNRKLGIL